MPGTHMLKWFFRVPNSNKKRAKKKVENKDEGGEDEEEASTGKRTTDQPNAQRNRQQIR